MTVLYEERHENESWLMWKLGNFLSIDSDYIKSIGFAWIFKENGKWVFTPRITGEDSMYFNAVFFIRFLLPFGIFWGIRWSESSSKKALWQAGIGFKLNGRFAITFRVQSDDSAEAGYNSPNPGQAKGFEYGGH